MRMPLATSLPSQLVPQGLHAPTKSCIVADFYVARFTISLHELPARIISSVVGAGVREAEKPTDLKI